MFRCKEVSMGKGCQLRRWHPGLHWHQERHGRSWADANGYEVTVGPTTVMWASSVSQVRESGLFAPWVADALDELAASLESEEGQDG